MRITNHLHYHAPHKNEKPKLKLQKLRIFKAYIVIVLCVCVSVQDNVVCRSADVCLGQLKPNCQNLLAKNKNLPQQEEDANPSNLQKAHT
jgi:hypothetical protein